MVNAELSIREDEIGKNLRSVRRKITSLKDRLDRHYEALEAKVLSMKDVAPRIKELSNLISDAQAAEFELLEQQELSQIASVSEHEVLQYALDSEDTLEDCGVPERRRFLSSFIERIWVSDQGI